MIHTYKCTHSFDGDNDYDLVITYTYNPGSPPTGGDPEEYPEIDVLTITVDGIKAGPQQWDDVIESERLYNEMSAHAVDCIADEQAAAEEYRAETRDRK
jgi:hypothetical protein